MAALKVPSYTDPSGAFDWLLVFIGACIVITLVVFWAVGFI